MLTCLLVIALIVLAQAAKKDAGPVTCGSVVKLMHKDTVCSSLVHCLLF